MDQLRNWLDCTKGVYAALPNSVNQFVQPQFKNFINGSVKNVTLKSVRIGGVAELLFGAANKHKQL